MLVLNSYPGSTHFPNAVKIDFPKLFLTNFLRIVLMNMGVLYLNFMNVSAIQDWGQDLIMLRLKCLDVTGCFRLTYFFLIFTGEYSVNHSPGDDYCFYSETHMNSLITVFSLCLAYNLSIQICFGANVVC